MFRAKAEAYQINKTLSMKLKLGIFNYIDKTSAACSSIVLVL